MNVLKDDLLSAWGTVRWGLDFSEDLGRRRASKTPPSQRRFPPKVTPHFLTRGPCQTDNIKRIFDYELFAKKARKGLAEGREISFLRELGET